MTKTQKRLALLLPLFICLAGVALLFAAGQRLYRQAAFVHLSAFCQAVVQNAPEAEALLLSSLKEYQAGLAAQAPGGAFLAQYGYTAGMFGGRAERGFFALAACVAAVLPASLLLAARYGGRRCRARLSGLARYLEQVNLGAAGTVLPLQEDGFSLLQDEIYKTVTNLYATREAAVAAKERFAENLANIAHQLKTPVTAALLSVQLMEQAAPGSPYAAPIQKQLRHLARLEEALLLLSRLDSGALRLAHAPVDLYTALSLAADGLDELLAKQAVRVEIPDNGCVAICGDLEWTMEALLNLMKDCLEHSPPGGTVYCDYAQNPLYAEVRIRDEGPGFAPEDLPHLFRRFYRGKDAAPGGIGIGLALARSILALENATLTARNLPAGGACFEVRFYGPPPAAGKQAGTR